MAKSVEKCFVALQDLVSDNAFVLYYIVVLCCVKLFNASMLHSILTHV